MIPIAQIETTLPNRGITNRQISDLMFWSLVYKKEQKIIFFDWDRTISVLEGFFTINAARFNRIGLDGNAMMLAYTKYILGGNTRFEKIRRLFAYLHSMQVDIYILTNNSSLINKSDPDKSPNLLNIQKLLEIIHFIDPLFNPQNLIVGASFDAQIQKSNKVVALQSLRPKWQIEHSLDQAHLPRQQQIYQRLRNQRHDDQIEIGNPLNNRRKRKH